MNEVADIADAHQKTLRRLAENAERLTELACARASAAIGADDGEAAARWMEVFDRLARGLRLTIALEARAHRGRWLESAAAPDTPRQGPTRPQADRDPIERDPTERDHECDDDGLPADASFEDKIERLCDILEDAADAFAPPLRLIPPRRAPTWADVPASLLELADRRGQPPPPRCDSG